MAEFVKLNPNALTELRQMNPRLISYNVEMTEVTGGTFWKAYTDAQIDGTEQVPPPDFSKGVAAMHQWYDPIDTTNPRLIKLAKALGSCWVRVSGTWATRTYYDFDETGLPEGYFNHLHKDQWINLLNFVKAVNGKMRSRTMLLNGKELVQGENDELPEMTSITAEGTIEVAPGGCTFIVL